MTDGSDKPTVFDVVQARKSRAARPGITPELRERLAQAAEERGRLVEEAHESTNARVQLMVDQIEAEQKQDRFDRRACGVLGAVLVAGGWFLMDSFRPGSLGPAFCILALFAGAALLVYALDIDTGPEPPQQPPLPPYMQR